MGLVDDEVYSANTRICIYVRYCRGAHSIYYPFHNLLDLRSIHTFIIIMILSNYTSAISTTTIALEIDRPVPFGYPQLHDT